MEWLVLGQRVMDQFTIDDSHVHDSLAERPVLAFNANGTSKVSLRRFPYPYRAALAICSDIDDTETTEEFLEIQRFLNTKYMTSMGEGVGLEIGNSFYFYDDERFFSYFTHHERARSIIRDLIRAGYIDCLHTYGDRATSREQIMRALEVLAHADGNLDVWVNHNGSRSNFGRKFDYLFPKTACLGDTPGADVYHADVTIAYGIRFVWVGAMTRIVGQSAAATSLLSSLSTVFDQQYPLHSAISMLKEMRKHMLGKRRDERFMMHQLNQLTQVMQLADGQKVHEFVRYCDHPRGIPYGGTGHGLGYLIAERVLEQLKAVQGLAIIYTHFGQNRGAQHVIPPQTRVALRNLAREYREGNIYVTTTSRLLNYHHAYQYLNWSHHQTQGRIQILIDGIDDPVSGKIAPTTQQLQGLTFHVPDRHRVDVYVCGRQLQNLQRNAADDSGVESVTIPRIHLVFPY